MTMERRSFLKGMLAGIVAISLPVVTTAVAKVARAKAKITKKKIKCVWNMGSDCCGEVTDQLLFGQQIVVPICERHFNAHKKVMALHAAGVDVEELLQKEESDHDRMLSERNINWKDVEP